MNDYLVKKIYNSSFVDVAPLVIANILSVDVNVMYYVDKQYDYHKQSYEKRCNVEKRDVVFVILTGNHYDGIICKTDSCMTNTVSCDQTSTARESLRPMIDLTEQCPSDGISTDDGRSS